MSGSFRVGGHVHWLVASSETVGLGRAQRNQLLQALISDHPGRSRVIAELPRFQ
jgi:hypothetical protein